MDGPTPGPDGRADAVDGGDLRIDSRAGTVDGDERPVDGDGQSADGLAGTLDGRKRAIARLCYAGESAVEVVPFSGGVVGVTTHRVLALTPDGDGPNLQAVDRPNVTSIELSSGGDDDHGMRALRFGLYAVLLVGASYLIDFSGVSGVDPPSGTGAGQVIDVAMAMLGVLSLVDDVLRLAGLAVLVVALLFAAAYGRSRDSYLAIGVAGGDPVRVPAAASESAAATRLRVAVEKASNPSDG